MLISTKSRVRAIQHSRLEKIRVRCRKHPGRRREGGMEEAEEAGEGEGRGERKDTQFSTISSNSSDGERSQATDFMSDLIVVGKLLRHL